MPLVGQISLALTLADKEEAGYMWNMHTALSITTIRVPISAGVFVVIASGIN